MTVRPGTRLAAALLPVLLGTAACASTGVIPPTTTETSPGPNAPSTQPDPELPEPTRGHWYGIWTPARLPEGFRPGLEDIPGVEIVSVVRAGNAAVVETRDVAGSVVDSAPEGFSIPVEMQRIDPARHGLFVPPDVAAALNGLAPDEVLLTESSAALRRLERGATIWLADGTGLTVAGIVPDRWVGAAELVTTRTDAAALGVDLERYAVVRYSGGRDALQSAIEGITNEPVRIRSVGETEAFRHADAVRPQVAVKLRFGEFAYRPAEGRHIEIDPAWVEANIVTVELPLLGQTVCHGDFAELLDMVLRDLETHGLGHLIDANAFLGCWNPRFISGRRDLSRHAWGIAADINFGNEGDGSPMAPELLAAMAQAGITSGHDWLIPDPGHFEWYGSPSLESP